MKESNDVDERIAKERKRKRDWYRKKNAIRSSNYRKLHPEKAKEAVRKSWLANRVKYQAKWEIARLKRKYGLTPELLQAMREQQGGACAICRRHESEFKRRLHVDHDHSTHLIRGLLCWGCNSLLPCRKDLIFLLTRAISYLSSPPALRAIGEHYTGKPKP